VGNPGNNPGLKVSATTVVSPNATQSTVAQSIGVFNRSLAFGNGATATAVGGPDNGKTFTPLGNNTAR